VSIDAFSLLNPELFLQYQAVQVQNSPAFLDPVEPPNPDEPEPTRELTAENAENVEHP